MEYLSLNTFKHSLLNTFDDKEEYICNIFFNDKSVGYCKYCKKDLVYNIVYIEFIYIDPLYRKMGFATAMVKELQSKFKLDWDYRFTEQGREWYERLVEKKIVTKQR